MRAIFIGCEYVGKTALASELVRWLTQKMGDIIPMHGTGMHDHFTPPYIVDPGTPNTEIEMDYRFQDAAVAAGEVPALPDRVQLRLLGR